MPTGPADPLWDGTGQWRPTPSSADWPDWADEAYLAALAEDEYPGDLDLYQDPDSAPPPGLDDERLAALITGARQVPADQAAAAWLAGRRGPGMPGSGRRFPGEFAGPAAGFGSGRELDTAPGCAVLALFAEGAAGEDDRYQGASEDELVGAICAWDRVEAHASARKHAAVAELIRRRPEPDCALEGPGQMPQAWEEFTPVELAPALGESRGGAEGLLSLAMDLAARLPGTAASFRSGIINADKAAMIARAAAALDPAEARAAEAMVLGRAGRLTPGGLRAAIGHGCARPAPAGTSAGRTKRTKSGIPGGGHDPPDGHDPPGQLDETDRPRFTFSADGHHGPPGGYGTWRLRTGHPEQRDLIVALGPIATGECDHRHEAAGHDPGVMLRHLTQVRQASCTGPACRRPAIRCDFEHNVPFEAGGRTCECNGGPKCRFDHRLKQHPRWKAEQPSPGIIVWTTPAGRRYTTEPTRYPI